MDSVKEKIEKRAYHLFMKRGGLHGYHVQDWHQAEKEVMAELEASKKIEVKKVQSEKPAPVVVAEPVSVVKPKIAEPVKPAAPVSKPVIKTGKKGK